MNEEWEEIADELDADKHVIRKPSMTNIFSNKFSQPIEEYREAIATASTKKFKTRPIGVTMLHRSLTTTNIVLPSYSKYPSANAARKVKFM